MKVYKVEIAGVEHTIQLSDEDAKARGVFVDDEPKQAEKPATKQATVSNKSRPAKNKSA